MVVAVLVVSRDVDEKSNTGMTPDHKYILDRALRCLMTSNSSTFLVSLFSVMWPCGLDLNL